MNYLATLSLFFKSIGYAGFTILFDECEITLDISQSGARNAAYNYIREFIDNNEFTSTLFVFAGIPLWFDDKKKGIRSNQALYSRIKDPISKNAIRFEKPIINLGKLSKNELMKLCTKILKIYENVYDSKTPNKISPYVSLIVEPFLNKGFIDNDSLRDFIREFIAYLDIIRENPEEYKYRQDFINLINGQEADDW